MTSTWIPCGVFKDYVGVIISISWIFTTVSGQEIKVTFFQQDAVTIQIVVCMATHCSLSTMLPLKTQLIGVIKKYFAIVYFSVSSTKSCTLNKVGSR